MALIIKDRVKVTSGDTGTGTFTLGAAVLGFQDFSAIGDSNTTYYTIALQSGDEWEVGIGTVTDTGGGVYTLSRDTILESSNAGAAVNFSAGTKDVFVTYPADRAVYLNAAGTEVKQQTFDDITANNISLTTGSIATTPIAATDIPNKLYVDEVAEGLKAKPAAELATTADLSATYDNGTAGVGATLTATVNGAFPTIDGVTLTSTNQGVNGVLVKDQTNPAENGRYNLTTLGDANTPWVLTRCGLCDEAEEIPGAYVFVKGGTLNGNTGWVQTVTDPATFVVGTDPIILVQFFGAGTFTAGTGLTLTGTEFSITNTGTAGTYGTASQVPVLTTNAQGQVTGVTNTAIAIASSAVSGLAASATTDTTNAANITSGTLPTARLSGSYTGITGVGALTAGTWNATTIAVNRGGTGLTSYTVGDIVFADGSASLAKLPGVATGNALLSGGVGTAPQYGKVGLTTHVSGTLPIGNGGTGQTTAGAAINALLPAQTSQSGRYLTTDGTNPSWAAVPAPNNGTLTMNVSGTGLSGSATFTADQAGASTFTVTSNATSANTNSTIVARDASGNFSAGTVTAALSGNATTATTLQTARNINGVSFNGSANITITANTPNSVTFNNGGAGAASGTTFNGGSAVTVSYNTVGAPSTTGANASGSWGISITGSSASTTGNAATATTLQTARTINGTSFNGSANITTANWGTARTLSFTGDVTGSSSVNGSANVATAMTLANSGVTAGSYGGNNSIPSITVDAKGRVTAASTVTPSGTYAISISGSSASTTGNAATATALQTARLIGGVSFNGTANINLPGVNTAGNQNTSGNAATATALQTARTINGVSFNGTANITVADATKLPLAGGSMTGTITLTGNSTSYRQNNTSTWSGNPGTGQGKLEYHSNRWYVVAGSNSTEVVRFRRSATDIGHIDNSGNMTMSGDITAFSDERLKKDWVGLPTDFIDRVAKAKAGTFTRIDDGSRQAGSSAQEWEKLLPEVVHTQNDERGTLSLAYGNAALVTAIELAKVVVDLKAEVESLKAKLKD